MARPPWLSRPSPASSPRGLARAPRTLAATALAAGLAAVVAGTLQAGGGAPAQPHDVGVSKLGGPQTNPTIAIDPSDSRILIAGSNSVGEGAERVYSSADGGTTWSASTVTPPVADLHAACPSDPGVAIDLTGRQYYSFDRATPCASDSPSRIYVV